MDKARATGAGAAAEDREADGVGWGSWSTAVNEEGDGRWRSSEYDDVGSTPSRRPTAGMHDVGSPAC